MFNTILAFYNSILAFYNSILDFYNSKLSFLNSKLETVKNEFLCTQGTYYLYTLVVFQHEKWLSSKCGKKFKKKNLRIVSKPLAHHQTMTKTPVKFRKDPHKTVGGVVHTRCPLKLIDARINARTHTRTWATLNALSPFYEWQWHRTHMHFVWPSNGFQMFEKFSYVFQCLYSQ